MKTSTNSCLIRANHCLACLTLFFCLTAVYFPANATVRYVKTDGNDSNTGLDWDQAYQTVQKALEASVSGDEIWVKAGTYFPTKDATGNANPADQRDKTFYLKNGVALYGGFAGTEDQRSQRNWTANLTTLSGDLGTANVNTDNAYHVLLSVSDASTTILDGFTVEKGNSIGSTGSISVESLTIDRDEGAGMHCRNSSMMIANCIFTNNTALNYGGGVSFTSGNPAANVSNCTFSNNTAAFGAGVSVGAASPTFTDCTFSMNVASQNGGGMLTLSSSPTASPVLNNCTFDNNTASVDGGGYYATTSSTSLTDCTFTNNTANHTGGGMYNTSSQSPVLNNCVFSGNTAVSNAGGVYNSGTMPPTFTNCLFSGNKTNGSGGGMYNSTSATILMNCTFSGNHALTNAGGMLNSASNPVLTNCLIWNNRAGTTTGSATASMHSVNSSTPVITYSLIQNHNPSGTGNINGLAGATLSNYPNFTTPLDPATAPSTAGDFHLVSGCSPVIGMGTNTGAPAADLFGNARPFGTNTDMGVHEFQGAASCPAQGTVWYVDAANTGCNLGTSWACAFQNLQDAIDAASSGHEVWVKADTYLPTRDPSGNASPTDPRDKTFYLKSGVKIYGGFDGTENSLAERDPVANLTTISGDIGTANDASDNCYHVVLTVSDANTTQFDGFTVSGGNANGTGSVIVGSSNINRFHGGGMYINSSALMVKNITFSSNACTERGAGTYATGATPTFTDCVFSENTSANLGGGAYHTSSTASFSGCTFSGNTANSGGGMRNETASNITLNNCIFKGNSATSSNGGGFYIGTSSTSATLTNCLVSGNSAGGTGGGIYNSATPMTMTNCVVTGNICASSTGGGGIIFLASITPVVKNCIVWNNRSGATTGNAGSSIQAQSGATPDISYSLIQAQNPSGTGNLNGITNAALSNYPEFVTPLDPATAPSTAGDFHVTVCSPVLNLGDNTGAPATDLFGNARPFATTVDMGVHEVQSAAVSNPTTANAGPDQTGAATCGLTQVTLAANTPTIGTGAWSIISGAGGAVTNPSSPTSTFTGTAGTAYQLRWTISNAPCTASTDDVLVTFNQNPTPANAGPDQTGAATCGLTQVTLAANTPTVGTGAWSVISGAGGTVTNPSSPTSTFTGTAGTAYLLRWTISNSPCNASPDDVLVTFNRNPTTANAGPNQNVTVNSATMAANTPTVGTGAWSLVSGSGTITTPASPTTTITNLGVGANTFRWTISNSPCPSSTSDVTVTYSPSVVLTCPMNSTTAACQTQAAVDLAFSNWLATASASGGCNGMLDNDNTGAPSACGGSTTVTFTYTSTCAPFTTTCQATFTVTAPTSPVFTNCNNTINLGCNPNNFPTCTSIASGGFGGAVTASNSCGPVTVSCSEGQITMNGCSRQQIFTFTATACGLTSTCTRTYNWTEVTPPSFNGTCGNGSINLGCNPVNLPACDPNVTASNQCGPVTVTCNVGSIIVNGCNRQQTLLYVANAPGCGNFSTCQRIFNWQVTTAPVFSNCDNTFDLGCNPGAIPTCANVQTAPFGGAVTATNECGNVTGITCSEGAVTTNGCNRTKVFTFTITGCGFTTTCTRTFTWKIASAPVFNNCNSGLTILGCNPATLPSCDLNITATSECGPATVVCTPGAITSSGCNRQQIFTYVATGECASNTCTRTFTWQEDPVAILECPGNTTTAAGQTQAAIDDEFSTWLSDASFSGGCDGDLTNNSTGAPPACGGSTMVTFTLTTACRPVQTCQATFTVAAPTTGTVWYVNPTAPSGGNGASWDCAFQHVQDAIDAASSGHEVWVKAGTYLPTKDPSGNASPADPRDKTFYLKNGVKIFGGFAGTEAARIQRNPSANATILSGDLGTTGVNTDNSYHVVLSVSDDNTTELDGFTVSGGNANLSSTSITVESQTIQRSQGGGIYNVAGSLKITNCVFTGNNAQFEGGGMLIGGSSTAAVTNCVFSGNTTANVGAGGGTYVHTSSPTLTNCLFSGNSSGNGGGILLFNGAPVLTNCTLTGNKANNGGGLTNINSTGSLVNCLIWNNLATVFGGNHSLVNNNPAFSITYSLLQNLNPSGTGNLNGTTHGSNSNFPDFLTPLDPATAPSTAGDFHVTACSPVLNVGTNTGAPATDLFGNARPFGSAVDMGIHELQSAPTAPVALCQNTSVTLNAGGMATLDAASVNNGSTGCLPLGLSVSPSTFDCSDWGTPQTVTLTVTGINNASSTCTATVTVVDNTLPNALCRDFVKNLGSNGMVSITAAEVNNLSNDNCSTVNLVGVSPSSFDCDNIGMNSVTLTVNDGHGNSNTCTGNVTITDVTAPSAVCKNISVNLGSNGMASIMASQVNDGSSDNCGIASMGVSPSSFTCASIGNQIVTLTVTDDATLSSTCTATVTVTDATAPTAVCQNINVNLGANGTVGITGAQVNNGSSDNCGIASLSVSPNSFNCSHVGNQTVTLTVTDNSNLSSTCMATVTVADADDPMAVCQNITVNLDANGNATITGAQVDGGSTDNCGILSRSVTPNMFDINDLGANPVTLTVTDNNNRTATCTATVTVTNTNAPNAVCQPFTAILGSNGQINLAATDVDGGSTAIGGIASMSVLPDTRTCANIGNNNVTLTVVGNNGQQATCIAIVTVQDNTPPTVVCKNISVNLSGNAAGILPAQVLDALLSSDNCGTVTAADVMPNSFNCNDLGGNSVTLTANDGHGNTNTCTATVTVNDVTPPTLVCQNISVNLNTSGMADIIASQVYNAASSSDNCGTVNLVSVSPNSFNCNTLGARMVTLTANDGHGNTNTCTATVTVNDNLSPNALCRDIVVQLDANGNATITASQVNNGSSDNCSLGTLSVSPNSFTISDLGINPVTLTVPDVNGNSASCIAQVTVENNQLPNAVCQNISRNLDANGQVLLADTDVDDGSSALGGIASFSVSPNLLDCDDLGPNTVTLTVFGNNGQQASCNATVTVTDAMPPTAICQNVSVALNNGTASVTALQINNGSTDNCGTVNLESVVPSMFTCTNVGPNMVTLTINDGNGNTSTCTATVTVNGSGTATWYADTDNDGFGDPAVSQQACDQPTGYVDNDDDCDDTNFTIKPSASEVCNNVDDDCDTQVDDGLTFLDYYADGDGDSYGAGAAVNACQSPGANYVLQGGDCNDGNSQINLAATEVCNNVDDDCDTQVDDGLTFLNYYADGDGDSYGAGAAVNACQSPGANYVLQGGDCNDGNSQINLAATEVCNNVDDDCDTQVDEGVGSPTIWYADTDMDGYGDPAVTQGSCAQPSGYVGNDDDCDDTDFGIKPSASEVCNNVDDDCDTQIDEGALLTFYKDADGDTYGNSAVTTQACAAPATYVSNNTDCDDSDPLEHPGQVWYLDADGDDYSNGTDQMACLRPANYYAASELAATTGDCNDGNSQINLAATEACNNVDDDCDNLVDAADPDLADNTPPLVTCKNATVYLNATGTASLAPADVFLSGSDDCGTVAPVAVAPGSFNCNHIFTNNTVTLTANDGNGNNATCTATVTVVDQVPPTAVCKNAVVQLGSNGSATILPSAIYQSGSDNCGTVNLVSVSPTWFGCANIGTTTATLTVNDGHGNVGTCTATVTVQDNLPPQALCKNATVSLNANGIGTITVANVDNGSTDNCGIASITASPLSFTCANLGSNTVALAVSDMHGNASSCNAVVTVLDNAPPMALCQGFTVNLNADGSYPLTPSMLFAGGNDNCGTVNLQSVTPSIVYCSNIGQVPVTLKVNDGHGNIGTCQAMVTVNPFLSVQSVTTTATSCEGNDGSITIEATVPGVPNAQIGYSIDGGVWFSFFGTFTDLPVGNYDIVVRVYGAGGCDLDYGTVTVGSQEGNMTVWYKDLDGDGYTDGITETSCDPPAGYVAAALPGDCNDNDANWHPGAAWYRDVDNDGYSNGQILVQCSKPTGYKPASQLIATSGDCNDGNAAIRPAAPELCNGLDDDCDGQVDEGLSGLTYVGNVTFNNQAQVDAWSQCYTVIQGNLTIQNAGVENLATLANLVKVTGNVLVKSTGLDSLSWLLNLDTVGGNLTLQANSQLQTLHGLDSLKSVGGALKTFYNTTCAECCAIYELLNTPGGIGGAISVYGNETGCSSVPQINAACVSGSNLLAPPGGGCSDCPVAQFAESLSVWPNPTDRFVTVGLPSGWASGEITVLDLTGRTVTVVSVEAGETRVELDASGWASGLYLVAARLGEQVLTTRIAVK